MCPFRAHFESDQKSLPKKAAAAPAEPEESAVLCWTFRSKRRDDRAAMWHLSRSERLSKKGRDADVFGINHNPHDDRIARLAGKLWSQQCHVQGGWVEACSTATARE